MINLMELRQLRRRRIEAEAAEVEEVDAWLAKMRSGPEMVLYAAHPAPRKAALSKSRSAARVEATNSPEVGTSLGAITAERVAVAPRAQAVQPVHPVQSRPQQRRKKRRR